MCPVGTLDYTKHISHTIKRSYGTYHDITFNFLPTKHSSGMNVIICFLYNDNIFLLHRIISPVGKKATIECVLYDTWFSIESNVRTERILISLLIFYRPDIPKEWILFFFCINNNTFYIHRNISSVANN